MTKAIRIENADTSNHKIRVYAEHKNSAGVWVRDTAEHSVKCLDIPTGMITETVWKEKRLVIEEVE